MFPNIPAPGGENPGFSECARYHLAAKPRKGDAILFHSIQPRGALERKSLHTACPVIKGVKWSAAKWIHVRSRRMRWLSTLSSALRLPWPVERSHTFGRKLPTATNTGTKLTPLSPLPNGPA